MPSPFFIVGPTAVGKTRLAIEVAARCGAELVNADAFQLYAGLELLTAKPSADERRRIVHHLIGTVPLSDTYNVARYRAEAQRCLGALADRGCPAIIVGGSGMYIKALTHGLSPLPEAQPALREELESLEEGALLQRLRGLDPISATAIDARNRRRLIRAIEVCETTGRRFSGFRDPWYAASDPPNRRGVLLLRSKAQIDDRIKRRTHEMFSRGVVEEVRSALQARIGDTASRMIGLEQIKVYLEGQTDLNDCMERVEIATRQYAKRQVTWFKREQMFERMMVSGDDVDEADVEHVAGLVLSPSRCSPDGKC